jgi:rubrerythrin
VDIVSLLDRCIALERCAGAVYESLAGRFAADAELRELWRGMARDERGHAHKLETWRRLLASRAAEDRLEASGFEAALADLEALAAGARAEAPGVTDVERAFALALALETSELDVIYTTLLQSSPIARFPDARETVRRETSTHHETLVRAVRRRSRDEGNRLRAALLAAEEA